MKSVVIQKPEIKIWCIDGDIVVFIHMGVMVAAAFMD